MIQRAEITPLQFRVSILIGRYTYNTYRYKLQPAGFV